MAKRWTLREDRFIHAYASSVGVNVIANHDLERSAAAINARIEMLKQTGAWDALTMMRKGHEEYCRSLGADEFETEMATLVR